MFKIANLTDTNKRIRLTALDSAMSNIDDSVGAIAKDGRDILLCLAPKAGISCAGAIDEINILIDKFSLMEFQTLYLKDLESEEYIISALPAYGFDSHSAVLDKLAELLEGTGLSATWSETAELQYILTLRNEGAVSRRLSFAFYQDSPILSTDVDGLPFNETSLINEDRQEVAFCLAPSDNPVKTKHYWEGTSIGGDYYVGNEANFIWTVNGAVVAAEDLNGQGIYFEEKSTQADPYDPYSIVNLQRIVSVNPTPTIVTMSPVNTEYYQGPTEAPNSGSNYSADTGAGVTTFTFGVYEPELAAVVYLNETMRTAGTYNVYAGANDPEFGLKLKLVDYWTNEVLPAGSQTVNYEGTSYSYVPDVVFDTLPGLRAYAIENGVLEEGQFGPAATYYFPTEVYVDNKAVPLTAYRRVDTLPEDYNPALTSINISHWLPVADEFEVTVSGKTGIATYNGEGEVPYSVTIDGVVGIDRGNGINYDLKLTLPAEFITNGVSNSIHALGQYMGPNYNLTTDGNTELVVGVKVPGTAYNSPEPVLLTIHLTNITYA